MQHDRIFCFGDSITLGANDSAGLGWPGRLGRGLERNGKSVAVYNLGINGDTSEHIAARWQAESEARSRNVHGVSLFAFGFNDASRADGAGLQVGLDDSLTCAREIMEAASAFGPILWIGPTPLDEKVNPLVTEFASWMTYNADIERYDAAYARLANDLEIPYLQLFPDFAEDSRYQRALADGDGVHPGDEGYTLIAARITGWDAWQEYC